MLIALHVISLSLQSYILQLISQLEDTQNIKIRLAWATVLTLIAFPSFNCVLCILCDYRYKRYQNHLIVLFTY